MKPKDKRPKIEIIISEDVVAAVKNITPNHIPVNYNGMVESVIRDLFKSKGLDVTYCYRCGELKLTEDFYNPKHSICKACKDKSNRICYTENWHKAIEKTNGACAICGGEICQVHHIIPKSLGGTDELDNLIGLCSRCHVKAHNGSFRHFKGINEEIASKLKAI